VSETSTPAGRLLSGSELRTALNTPGRVFHAESSVPGNVGTSGFHLRLASWPLVFPNRATGMPQTLDTPDAAEEYFKKYPNGFKLQQGESAVVSTEERFALDLDLHATIGQRFSWAAKGLLMLHGGGVHPGYGRTKSDDGTWHPSDDDVRLYFVVANIGPDPVELKPGADLVFLQLFTVEANKAQPIVPSGGWDYLRRRLYGDPDDTGGLGFFRSVIELKARLNAQEARTNEIADAAEAAEKAADRSMTMSNYVVVFGVYLVAVALLGIVFASVADALSAVADDPEDWGWQDYATIVLAVVFAASAVLGTRTVQSTLKDKTSDPKDKQR
jgi:hypothetical protein